MPAGRLRGARARLALLGLLLLAPACASRPGAPRAPRETGLLVLWEIQSAANPRGRAFLLGSVHAARTDFALDPAIERAYDAADALVIEADITSESADAFGFVQRTIAMASLPEGQTLDQVLPRPTYERLGEFLRERGQPLEAYRRFEPWLLMTMVSSYIFAEAGLPAEGGVDLRLSTRAQEQQKPILALETPEFQLSLFDALPLDLQARMLGEMLDHQEDMRALSTRLFAAWERGDLDVLEAETAPAKDEPQLQEFHERVYVARNQAMAQRIDALLREEKTWLVVVGAGHVVGAQGIPTLLARSGHRIARVPKTAPAVSAPAPGAEGETPPRARAPAVDRPPAEAP